MTNTPNSEQRLDRIERILDTLASNQITERQDRLALREDLEILYQTVRQSTEQMAVNTTDISQLREDRLAMREDLEILYQTVRQLREDRLAMREDLEILYQTVRQSTEQIAVNTTDISQLREDRLALREDLEILYQTVRQSTEQIAVNTTAISQLREELHSEIAEVVGMIGVLAHSVEENGAYIRALVEQAERDRNQATIDRESFQTSIRDILAHLQTRYNGNGGQQTG